MRRSDWDSFEDFEMGYWATHPLTCDYTNPEHQCLACNGQFDDVPYVLWDEMLE